jgi:hypothetical protein
MSHLPYVGLSPVSYSVMNEAGLTDLGGEAVETISSGIRAGGSETNGFIGKREAEPSFTVVHHKAATFIGVAPPHRAVVRVLLRRSTDLRLRCSPLSRPSPQNETAVSVLSQS